MKKYEQLAREAGVKLCGPELEEYTQIIIAGAAKAAEESARSFSDSDGTAGCKVAANAVLYYGKTLIE